MLDGRSHRVAIAVKNLRDLLHEEALVPQLLSLLSELLGLRGAVKACLALPAVWNRQTPWTSAIANGAAYAVEGKPVDE